jgi:O-antigen/teichoic acid export membrane protein
MQAQKKDYIWNSIGSFLQSAISPILLIVITRLNGVGDSGLFSFAMSLSVVFWAISLWGGRTYQVSDVKKEFSSGDYIVVRFISSLIVAVFSISFCILSGYDLIKTELIMVLVSFKILESIADSMYGVLQIHNKLYIVGISLTMKSVFGFMIFAIVDILTKNIVHGALSIFIVNIAVVIFYDIPWMKHVESVGLTKKNIMQAGKIMKKTAEVFVVVFLTMFSLNIPRYFLDKYHYDQIGYFGIMAMPITLLTLFISFVLQPNVVNLSELLKEKKVKEFTKIVSKIDFITFTLGILFVVSSYLIGVWALNTVFGIDINNFRIDLTIMVIGAVANAFVSIYVNLLIILRRFKGQFYTLLVTNILAVVLSVYLIDRLAMLGSVLVFMIISFLQAIILLFIYKRSLKNVIMLSEDKVRYE